MWAMSVFLLLGGPRSISMVAATGVPVPSHTVMATNEPVVFGADSTSQTRFHSPRVLNVSDRYFPLPLLSKRTWPGVVWAVALTVGAGVVSGLAGAGAPVDWPHATGSRL